MSSRQLFKVLNVGSSINLLGVILRSIKPLFLIIIANLFDSNVFGRYTILYALVEVVSGFAIFGMEHALFTYISRYDGKNASEEAKVLRSAVHLPFIFALILSLPLLLAWRYVNEVLGLKITSPEPLFYTAIMIVILTIIKSLLAATRGRMDMKYQVILYDAGEPLLLLLLVPIMHWLGMTVQGILVGHCLCLLVLLVPCLIVFDRFFSLGILVPRKDEGWWSKEALLFGLDMTLPLLGSKFIRRIDLFIVNHYLPLDLVGIYGVATEISRMFSKIRSSYTPIVVPVLSREYSVRHREGVQFTSSYMAYFVTLISLPFLFLVINHGDLLLGLYGRNFSHGYETMLIHCFGVLFIGALGPAGEMLAISGKPRIYAYYCLVQIAVVSILGVLLTKRLGMNGAAWASSLAMSIAWIGMAIHARYKTMVSPFSREVIYLYLIGIVLILCCVIVGPSIRSTLVPFGPFLFTTGIILAFIVLVKKSALAMLKTTIEPARS